MKFFISGNNIIFGGNLTTRLSECRRNRVQRHKAETRAGGTRLAPGRPSRSCCLAAIWLLALALAPQQILAGDALESLPAAPPRPLFRQTDWLLDEGLPKAGVYRGESGRDLVLDNGLVRRVIRLTPNAATIALDDLRTGASLLRSVRPEALVTIDGKEFAIGGLKGQPNHAYLTAEWVDKLVPWTRTAGKGTGRLMGDWFGRLTADKEGNCNDLATALVGWIDETAGSPDFEFTGFTVVPVAKPFDWKRSRPSEERPWPPAGAAVVLHFAGRNAAVKGIAVDVRYEIYDGIPVIGKSLTITNNASQAVTIDTLTSEILAAVEGESTIEPQSKEHWEKPPIEVLSDYMFQGKDHESANRVAHWEPDPEYVTQVNYRLQTPCLLVCRPPVGPGVVLQPGESLDSFRVFLVLQDSSERERRGLTLRRTWRTLAPWTTENPLMMHVRSSNQEIFRQAVDQCAEVGFEMIIYTFGSGFDMEDVSDSYIERIKDDVAYAHRRGVQVGGYSLFSSRHIDAKNDVIHPDTGKPGGTIFGWAPCFGSQWGQQYEKRIKEFMERTGLDLLEHDGPYPGDLCASTSHPGHRGLADSQWTQWQTSKNLYSWCRERGIYVNQPDCYFLSGGNKTVMGYRETNWSLPREQQIIHARQNIYDGTWDKTPSMGWMFVPLTEYHGGGPAATIEPLDEHFDDYEQHLVNCLSAGVQACYRGPRLYDTDATKELVSRWVGWFKKYRQILESDVIHGRRPDGQDVDFLVHVNHELPQKGMAVVHNPLTQEVTRKIRLPLYYTGLTGQARIREGEDGPVYDILLDGLGQGVVEITVPPRGMKWLLIESPEQGDAISGEVARHPRREGQHAEK